MIRRSSFRASSVVLLVAAFIVASTTHASQDVLGSRWRLVGAVSDPAAALDPFASPSFKGQDGFDDVRTLDELRALDDTLISLVERVRPSVVLLRSEGARGVATGTAVIISKDGLLATCGHVGRRPGRNVTAVLSDGTEIRGRTLGQVFEGGVDCGLVQLEAEGRELPSVPLGTTDGLAPGDWVLALGYTHGIPDVMRPALVRVGRVLDSTDFELFIDAPIDAGDSGGPSFNLRGEVVGLNARCGRESWQNVATPVDRLSERLDELKSRVEASQQPPESPEVAKERAQPPRFRSYPERIGKGALERSIPSPEITSGAEASMVRVRSGDRLIAYGLVVDADGLVVTKASQLEPDAELVVESAARQRFTAREACRDASTDVALLRLDDVHANGNALLRPVQWSTADGLTPGAVVLTPRGFGAEPAFGFAAIERRESELDLLDGPYLGVQTRAARAEELENADVEHGVVVMRVMPSTAAERAGIEVGDLVREVEGEPVDSPVELRRALRRHQVGDCIEVAIVGADGEATLKVTLGRRADSNEGLRRGNTATPISRRSSGLGWLLAHDAVTEPEEMGTPLVDIDGRVVGMNIARYDRTATHAIDAARMADVSARLVQQARGAERANESTTTR